MAKQSAAKFAQFVEQRCKAKDGYIMGARGEKAGSVSRSGWMITQYSGAQKSKALYWLAHAERVWDCQGFAEGYVNQQTGSNIDVRARDNYASWCEPKGTGKIPNSRKIAGAAVFMYSSSERAIVHVGYLIRPIDPKKPSGDWYVGEARSVMYGCVVTKLSERGWNRWGWMTKYFDYSAGEASGEGEPIDTATGNDNAMGSGSANPYAAPSRILKYKQGESLVKGQDVKWVQFELNQSGERLDIDGQYGPNTCAAVKRYQQVHGLTVDGEVGPLAIAALLAEVGLCTHEGTPPPIDKGVIIDVSHHNGKDWDKAIKSGIQFVIARVQDNTVLDRNLKANVQAFHRLNIRYGLYAYVEASTASQARKEAELFYDRAMAAGAKPETWMIDAEESQNSAAAVHAYRARLRELVGPHAQIGIYSFDSAINGKYKSILPHFDVVWSARWNRPAILPAYKLYGLWQYGYVTVPGLGDIVDGNKLRDGLTLDEMLALRAGKAG